LSSLQPIICAVTILDLDKIEGCLIDDQGLPRLLREPLLDWIDSNVASDDRQQAWIAATAQWFAHFANRLENRYRVHESKSFMLLTSAEQELAEQVLRWCEYYRREIQRLIPKLAVGPTLGKYPVILFDCEQHYYDYVAQFYPQEGEYGGSGGMFIDEGVPHFVLPMYHSDVIERTIAHELTHAQLSHLDLPLWLNEGFTQVVEGQIIGSSTFWLSAEMALAHREFWNAETIQQFWSGMSFYRNDEGQHLSYELAEVLIRNLSDDCGKRLFDFVEHASASDAGQQALREACGVALEDCVAQFLGRGDWSPTLPIDPLGELTRG
jgi:hypothetical protein